MGVGGGGYYFGYFLLLFFLVFFLELLNKHYRSFILKIYHLRCSLTEQFILTAFIELKVANNCFEFR